MCLITTQKEPLIAKKAMTVYKALSYDLLSPYTYYQYIPHILYETEIKNSSEWSCYDNVDMDYLNEKYGKAWSAGQVKKLKCIGAGFHSALTKERLRGEVGEHLYECVIPSGSSYFLDETGLCVSNRIIIKGDATQSHP